MELSIVNYILKKLGLERPIFHSEADFQHALAFKLHSVFKESDIRLEKRFLLESLQDQAIYVDIFWKINSVKIALELKYVTKEFYVKFKNEEFALKNHSAQDHRRYDFLFDIYRLERLKLNRKIDLGYAIFLTNDPLYWKAPNEKKKTNDSDFRIHNGRRIKAGSVLDWSPNTGKGTKKGRETPIKLFQNYSFSWRKYSKFITKQNSKKIKSANKFYYLLIKV